MAEEQKRVSDGAQSSPGKEKNEDGVTTVQGSEEISPETAEKGQPPNTEENALQDKRVILHANAYKSVILFAARFANASIPKEQWKEIYGVLIGYIDKEKDAVVVEKAIALTSGESTDVHLEARHYAQIAEVEEQLFQENQGRFVVGWFHSHPGLTIFYSYIDIMNHLAFQTANPDFVGLVFDHTALEKEEGHHGFKIFKVTDVNLDMGDPNFENNYHEIPYEIAGINEFFFANVLAELSARSAARSPLELSYEEERYGPPAEPKPAAPVAQAPSTLNQSSPIPLGQRPEGKSGPSPTTASSPLPLKPQPLSPSRERENQAVSLKPLPVPVPQMQRTPAEIAIFEARKAHRLGDSFSAIEKYQEAIDQFRQEGNVEKALDVMKEFAETTLQSDHLEFADEWGLKLRDYAESEGKLFYLASANLILGQVALKRVSSEQELEGVKKDELINKGLEHLQEAGKVFEDVKDYAGAGLCNNQIADVQYYTIKDYFSAALFYLEALRLYQTTINEPAHPKRVSLWARPENIEKKIRGLRVFVENLKETRIDQQDHQVTITNKLKDLDSK